MAGRFSLVVLLASLSLVTGAITFAWTDCGTSKNHAKILNISWIPANPALGDNVTFVTNYTSDKVYTKGSTTISAPLLDKTFDTCAGAEIDTALGLGKIYFPPAGCPISTGAQSSVHYSWLSKHVPSETTNATTTSVDQDGEPVFCLNIQTTI